MQFSTQHTIHTQINTSSMTQKYLPRCLAPLLVGLGTDNEVLTYASTGQHSKWLPLSVLLCSQPQSAAGRLSTINSNCSGLLNTHVTNQQMHTHTHTHTHAHTHIYIYINTYVCMCVQFSIKIFHKFVSVILVTIIRVPYDKITINRQLIYLIV
jgi:hypothetical protein